MSDDEHGPDEREVTEEDAVVQTENGERYLESEVSKGGDARDD